MDGLRTVTPDDVPELKRLAREQEAELGWKVEYVDHFNSPTLWTLVHERDGRIVGGVTFEHQIEMCFLSSDAETTALVKKHSAEILVQLMTMGFTRVRSFVPKVKQLPEILEEHYKDCGFSREDQSLSHFSISLRAADGEQEKVG